MTYIVEIAALVIALIAFVGVASQKKSKSRNAPTSRGLRQLPMQPELPNPTEDAQSTQTGNPEKVTALNSGLSEQPQREPSEQAEKPRVLVPEPEQPEAPPPVPLIPKTENPKQSERHLPDQPKRPDGAPPVQPAKAQETKQLEPSERTDEPEALSHGQPKQPEAAPSAPVAEPEVLEQSEPSPPEQTGTPESLAFEQPEQPEPPQLVPHAESEKPDQREPRLPEQADKPELPAPEHADSSPKSVPEQTEHLPPPPLPASREPERAELNPPNKGEEPKLRVSDEPERQIPQPAEENDDPVPSRIDQITPYVPSIRTPETTKRRSGSHRKRTSGLQHRPIVLPVYVRVVFGRRNTVQLSLLPTRNGELEEEIQVSGPDGEETWLASQDEWYGDSVRSDIERCLANGMRWIGDDASWVLSPRDIYVLAPNSTIFGFVSATRLLLNENQLVLCRENIQGSVRKELTKAGCDSFECISDPGVPNGWVLFNGVRPTTAVDHETSAGNFNLLRPIGDIEVYLDGGIRLSHSKWLLGHPPRIRVRGGFGDSPVVSIDGEPASIAEDGSYCTPDAFTLGQHVVFCAGVTTPFEIVEGRDEWDLFVAYEHIIGHRRKTKIAICGPTIMGHGEQTLVPATNRCLVGAEPGEIYFCEPAYAQATNELLAITDFPVVWALPDNPYHCNKERVFAVLKANIAVGPVKPHLRVRPSYDLLRWCSAILDSSRKGLRTDPAGRSVAELWSDYVRAARQIRRSTR